MRARLLIAGLVVAATMLVAEAAAQPVAGARYSGSGTQYTNNAPAWKAGKRQKFSFTVASDRRTLREFAGGVSLYCGGTHSSVTAKFIDIHSDGTFSYRFKLARQSHGRVVSETYISITGRFSGRTAAISYLVDAAAPVRPKRSPYSTKNPAALACASWVRGTARAA